MRPDTVVSANRRRLALLGCYRFLLAALVAVSHLLPNYGITMPSINFGAAAVVCFYFISGYLMFFSFSRFRRHTRDPAWAFYADRLMRLYPSYLLAYTAASVWLFFGVGVNIFASFEWVSEVLVIPANYTLMALPLPAAAAANPPTWSLGAEFQFYLLLPALMVLGSRARAAVLALLLVAQLGAMAVSGPMSIIAPWCRAVSADFCFFPVSDLLAYRWLPLAMTPFVLGAVTAEQAGGGRFPWALAAATVIYACAFLVAEFDLGLRNPSSLEVSSAMVLLVPIAYVVLKRLSKPNAWDRAIGNLAYPLFLDHILCISITNKLSATGWYAVGVFTVLALVISSAIAVIQIGVDRVRYRQRGFGALARSQARMLLKESPAI